MSEFDPETSPLSEVDEETQRRIGYIIQENADMMNASRDVVRKLLELAQRHRDQAEELEEICSLVAIGTRRIADINGDLISAEMGIAEAPEEEADELEDEDGE